MMMMMLMMMRMAMPMTMMLQMMGRADKVILVEIVFCICCTEVKYMGGFKAGGITGNDESYFVNLYF